MKIGITVDNFVLKLDRVGTIFVFAEYGGHLEFENGNHFHQSNWTK